MRHAVAVAVAVAVAAVAVAIAASVAAPPAHADPATSGLFGHPFSVSCGEGGAPSGTYCKPYAVTVSTGGRLEIGYTLPGDNRETCQDMDVEFSIDGRVWNTVRRRAGSYNVGGGPGIVTPGPHTISLRGRRVNNSCVPMSHFGGYLNISWTIPRINRLDLSFADRLAAAKRDLQPAAQRIAQRKTQIERLVLEARARGQAALNRKASLDAQLRRVYDDYIRTRRALARLYSLQPRQNGGEGFTQAIRQVGNRIGRLEATIVQITRRTGRTPTSLQGNLARERRTLADLQEGLDERRTRENRDLRRRWRQGLQDSQDQLHDLRLAEARADYERAKAFGEIRELLSERTALDREAFQLADRLKTLDLDVREIRATAGGELVYHATGRREDYERLKDLNERIELARQALADLDAKREELGETFFAAQREVIAVEALLASRIMTAAGLRAFVDFAFNLFDVGVAFARGGPIGALSETAKKALETAISNAVTPSSGFAPDSIEARINAQYDAGLKEAITGERIGKTVAERVVKETVLKAGRDTLNQWLASEAFGDLGVAFASTPSGPSPFSRSLPSLKDLREWNRAARYLDHTEGQIKNLKQGFRANRGSLGSALEGALKDLAKSSFKEAIDELEEAAWRGFIEKEMIARSQYAVYKVAVDLSFDAFEAHDAFLAAKQRVLDGARDDDSAYRLHVSKTFPDDAQLEIRVTIVRQTQEAVSLALLVGGARAELVRREGDTLVYRLGARSIDSGDQGLATLEVR